ncbi:MAG: PQQ-binding-like beta-propeller repeat protein [Saprospiraceae bacterium]|nr:PQQ-binding-like beta-propeller repeat protein [Saprospiraceae bacterium]MBP7921180.1 PQQ-binding-like beta-propeller repeat protein [Saprospiraceae bacterium]MBP8094027.1 PQQ-binding-like beta-propeller repeat protein [Saprospiraceae bacterium]
MALRYTILLSFIGLLSQASGQTNWTTTLPGLGSFSSCRVADLNGDGTDDIIMGAGRLEFEACDSAVIALDGKTGKLLWHVAATDQIFGSAIFQDIDKDGHPDALICGRSSELIMISGISGKVLWRFNPKSRDNRKHDFYNFYNPQWIPDEDGDGLQDIVVSNGGDVKVAAYDPNRRPGYLLIMSAATGAILHLATMPDRKEIYMSVTVNPTPDHMDYEILFGSGGETLGGHLYLGLLSQLRAGDLSKARILDSTVDRGYIGPAARADVNGDGVLDLFVNSVNGRMLAYDGVTYQKLWEIKRPETETYSSITVGLFNEDTIPDFFASYAMGSWPKLDWSTQFMADGKTGKIQFIDSLGFYQNSSAVAVDWDGDGRDEVLMSVNIQEIKNDIHKYFYNILALIDFKTNEVLQIGDTYEGNNVSSTPWVGDLDHDGFLDILYIHGTNLRHTYTFDGMQIHRIVTTVPVKKKIKWGAYQGSDYTGLYKNND